MLKQVQHDVSDIGYLLQEAAKRKWETIIFYTEAKIERRDQSERKSILEKCYGSINRLMIWI
jgi:hypothetical protein